jgi:exodeoxyribonuclease VII small subunit
MAKKKVAKSKSDERSFEQSLGELEQIVADLEGGELGLDEALEAYEKGVRRLKQCQARLEAAERRIELLSGVDAEGNPVTRPLDEPMDESPEGEAASRSRKRTSQQGSGGVDDRGRLF